MNVFIKQAARKPVLTLLMVLLLALAVALSCIGCAVWTSARLQMGGISDDYTTIAVPIDQKLGDNPTFDEIDAYAINLMRSGQAVQDAPQVVRIDRRGLLSAHVEGLTCLSSTRYDPAEYNTAFDFDPYSLAIFALRCESIELMTGDLIDDNTFYKAQFSVIERVCVNDAYDCFPATETMQIMSDVRDENAAAPFEPGKSYLVLGRFTDYPVIRTKDGYEQYLDGLRKPMLLPYPTIESIAPEYTEQRFNSEGKSFLYPLHGMDSWVCEYTGSVEDFLNSAEGARWREELIPLCETNHDSATLVLTDDVTSIYSFNTGEMSLLAGRLFNKDEYANGGDVCVVSASYAELNNLALGDTLTLELYDSGYIKYERGADTNSRFVVPDPGPYYVRGVMTPESAIGVRKPYTIVGIYTSPRFGFGDYFFRADTIFAPKASVPAADDYTNTLSTYLNSYVLENGSAEAFQAYMEEQGFGGYFLCFDQQFEPMEESLEALEANAQRLMLLGIGAFALVCALFLFLNFRRMRAAIRGVRLLGCAPRAVFLDACAALLGLELIAVVIGAFAAGAAFNTIALRVFSADLVASPATIGAAAALAFAVAAVASAACAAVAVRENLMGRK